MYDITFQQMAAFLMVAEELNITVVAENNYVSQASLSKMIQRFEERVGVKLFERANRSIKLTAEGRVFYERVLAPFQSICDTIEDIREIDAKSKKIIRIGYPSTVNINRDYYHVPEVVSKFKRSNPDIIIEEGIYEATDLKKLLALGKVDVIFLQDFLFEKSRSFEMVPIFRLGLYIAVGKDNSAIINGQLNLQRLREQPIYTIAESGGGSLIKYLNEFRLNPTEYSRVPNFESLIFAISHNPGYALVGNISELTGIRVFPLKENTHELCMIYRKNGATEILEKFLKFIQKNSALDSSETR